MNVNRKELIEYFTHIINIIDTRTEQEILAYQNKKHVVQHLNASRDLVINNIREIEKQCLDCLNQNRRIDKFCLFIPQMKELIQDDSDLLDHVPKFIHKVGNLVIINEFFNKKMVEPFMHRRAIYPMLLDTFEDYVKCETFQYLFYRQINIESPISIDFTNPEQNHLPYLFLSNNANKVQSTDFEFFPRNFNLKALSKLRLTCDTNSQLPNEIFKNFTSLTSLELLKCENLNVLKEGNFNRLENLIELKIMEANIDEIEENAFNGLVNLKKLTITHTLVTRIGSNTFNGLHKLQTLILNSNLITTIEGDSFKMLPYLELLQIWDNKIKCVHIDSFDGLSNLKIFDFEFQSDSFSFNHIEKIEILNLKSYELNKESLKNLSQLKFLNIRDCSIRSFDFLNYFPKLEYLDTSIQDELIRTFEALNLPSLRFLVLKSNVVPRFGTGFSKLKGLEIIELNIFHSGCFIYLSELNYLGFSKVARESLRRMFCLKKYDGIVCLKYFGVDSDFFRLTPRIPTELDDYEKRYLLSNKLGCRFISNTCDYSLFGNSTEKCFQLGLSPYGQQYFSNFSDLSNSVRDLLTHKSDSIYFQYFILDTIKRRLKRFVKTSN